LHLPEFAGTRLALIPFMQRRLTSLARIIHEKSPTIIRELL